MSSQPRLWWHKGVIVTYRLYDFCLYVFSIHVYTCPFLCSFTNLRRCVFFRWVWRGNHYLVLLVSVPIDWIKKDRPNHDWIHPVHSASIRPLKLDKNPVSTENFPKIIPSELHFSDRFAQETGSHLFLRGVQNQCLDLSFLQVTSRMWGNEQIVS